MKAHNSSVQERTHWDTILGTYENNLRRMSEKLNKELRQAHYSNREELCRKLHASCLKSAEIISHHRLSLGDVPRT